MVTKGTPERDSSVSTWRGQAYGPQYEPADVTNEQTMTDPWGWTGKEGKARTLFCGTDGMSDIAEILGRMEANYPAPSSTSIKLWQLRPATTIRPDSERSETMLEEPVAMLAMKGGYMPG